MAQDPTRVSPGDYSATAYDVLSKYDPAFPDNVSVEAFFDNLQSPEYAAKAYALLADADPELVNNLSIDDFIGNVKKKEEPVVTESVSGDGSSEQLPSTEIPEGALERKVNQFGQEVDELGVVLPQSDSPFELTDYRNRRKQATSQQDTAAIRLADQIQVEELERLEEERKIAAASMPAVPALEGREAPDYVAQLRQMYGPYGVRFETSTALGLGEFGSIKAYAVGADGNAVEHNIDIVDGKVVEAQLGGLNEFLQSNSRAKGGVEVDKRSLSEKALKVQEMRPVARRNEDGDQSTVKMEDAEYDGRFFSYPTLFPIGDGFSANPNDWMELDGVAAFDEAQRRGELFEFDTAEEANRFAKGEWKEIRETDAIAEQMWAEKGRNYYADETFLRRVEEAKKEYEFLESLVPGEQLFTGRMSDRYLDETEIPPAYQKYLTTYTDERGEKKLIARADIEEVREQKERELAALEQQFDNDNELLRLKEDYDEYLGQKRGEVMERAATLNQEGKVIQNRADVASINRFGVPVKGLLSMQPETEAEYNEMLGLLTQYNTGIEQRQVAALQYEKNKLYYDAQHEKLINQEYVDGFEEVWVKAKNGWSRGKAMSRLLLIHYGYYDAIGDEKAEEEAMREVSAIMDSMDTRVGRATSRTNMTGTTESFLERINPMDSGLDAATYTAALTAESLGQLLPIWFRILPVAAGAGAVYGAAGGPLGATFGVATTTLGAAGMGALAAVTTVGMPVSELALEMGNAILEVGERKGYDWADPNSALLALNDESVWKEGADRGYKRGIPIALTGMVSNMVMAKAALGGSRVLPLAERIALGVGTGVTVEPASEMLGEYLAIKATGEYTGSTANVKEIAAEGLGAIGMGVGFTTSLAALGYAKDVVTDANFDLALRLMDPDGISKENVRGERIVSWANRMERLGKIDAEQAEAIRKNVGRRRQANELLGKRVDSRPGSDSQVIGRIVELLEAKEELERSGPNVFGEKIRAITEEIALIAESGKVEKPGGAAVNLSDIRGRIRNRRAGAYKFNGKNVSRQDFLSKLQEATPRQLKRARAYNDIEAQRKLAKRRQDNAISKREAAEVPVGKRAGFGTEVDEEVREITQEVINDQAEGKLDEDQIETLLAPLAAKKARGEKLTDLEQQFAETNSSLLKRVEKDLKDLDKLVGDPNAQEQEGVTIIGKLTDRGKVVGKQARKAAKALRAAFPEVKIVLHSDDASFVEAAKKAGLKGTARAFYGFGSKEIHVHTGRAKATTVAHEAFHAALRNSIDASDVQALMGDFVTALKKVIPADSDLAAKLDDFAQGYSEGRVDEEYVAEFFGELATAYPTLDRKGKSVIARFLERLSKLINLDLTLPSDLTQRDEQILSLLETLAGKVARGKAIKGKQVSQFQELVSSSDTRGAAEQRAQTEDNLRAAEQKVSDFTMKEISGMSDNGVVGHFTNEAFDKFLPEFMKTGVYGAGFYFTGSTIIGKHYGKGPNATIAFVDINDMNLVDRNRVATPDELRAAANWLVDNDKVFISRFQPEDTSPLDGAMMNLTSTPYDSTSERRSKMGESLTLGQLHQNLQANFDEYQIEDDMGVITPVFNEVYPEYQGIVNRETESGTIVDMVLWDFDAINSNIVKPTRQFAEAAAKGKVSVADFTEIVYEPTVTPEERMAEMEEEMIRTKPETEAALRAAEQRADDFSDEQIQAMADEGVIFHFGPVDITKVIPEKLKRFGLGYGFYFTNYALEDSVFRSLGERVTMADSKELNMLDGDPDITEEQAKALRDAAKTELQEAEEYGDDLGFEESQVLMSISETRAGEKWYPYFTSSLNDSRKVESELTDEQKATATRLVQEVLGFDGVAYGSDQTNTGAVSSVWNFGKLNRAIIEPGQEPRAAEQRVDVESNEDNSLTFRTEGGRLDAFPDGNVVTLDNIAVEPDAQRRGMATQLVRAVMDEFRDQESSTVVDEDGNTIEEPRPYVIGFGTRVTPQGDAFYDAIIDEVEAFNRRNDGPPSFNEDGLPEVRAAEQRVDDLATSIQESLKFADASAIPNKFEFKDALQTRFNEDVLPQLKERYGIKSGKDLTPEMKEYLVDAYTNETLTALEAYPDALGWYDAKTKAAMSLMALLHPEIATDPDAAAAFKIVLAVTSNGNKVNDNFVEANRQYQFFKDNGRFDDRKTIGNQLVGIKSNLKFTNALLKEMSMEDFVSFLTTKHRVGDINAGNLNIIKGFGVNEEVYGAAIFGPKIGNGFFMNLYGEYGQLTIDRWFMRQYGRMTGTLLDYSKEKFDKADARLTKARKALLKRNSEKVRALIGDFEGMSKEEFSKAIFKTSAVEKNRKVLQSNEKLNEVRLSALAYLKRLEPEVEAPTPAVRRFLVEVFDALQQRLKDQYGIDMEIADLQAVNWYPEKALYQTFKEGQSAETGQSETSDNEQPDYETAAKRLVKSKGITDEQIQQDERGRKQETDRDNANRESIAETAAEVNPNNQEVERLREAVLDVKRSLKPGKPKGTEQRVDVEAEGPNIVYRSGAVDSKAESRGRMDGGRSTGHFGTGAYFFGDRESAEKYDDREVTAVDIRDYNLAPASRYLHDTLRKINGRVKYKKPHTFTAEEVEAVLDAIRFPGIQTPEILAQRRAQMPEAERAAKEATRLYNEPGNIDSASTSVMKALGYDGVYATPGSNMDNSTYGTVIYDVRTEAAEQRVVDPGVVDVLERYEFKPNNSLKNAELADELRRNLKRFGYGVKQYGTRMNDFRVVSLDTGRAVDPNKLIAAELEERRAVAEDQRIYREQQQARELEERIIEIYDADERPFTGRDFESNAAEQRSKIEAMSQPDDTMRDIVAKGREMGFRDSAIRAVLMKRYGRDSTEAINTALAENADIFTVIPKPFGNVVGGLDVGRQIYAEVRAKLNEFMRPKSPGRMTKQQRADRIAELRKAHPKQSKLSDSQLLRKFPRPKTTPTRAEMMAEALEILKANRRFKEQPEKVQKELLVGFATSLKSRANKGVQNLLSQIRRDLKERKKGAKTAREVQAQLRTLINEVLPKTDYSKADVAKLTKLINDVNEDNYIVKAQKVLDLVDRKREQIRKATIREIAAFVKRSAKTYKTPGGRTRTRGLDAPGQAFFLEAKRILTAAFKKDQTDIMNIGFNLANNPEVDIATAKLMNGESLTVKEQMLIDQKDAYDLFAPLANMSLEQVEAVLEDLKVTAGFSRLNLKNIRMERAARLNALRQGAKDSVEGNWGGVVTKEVEQDGETRIVAKDSNELATDRANKKSFKDIMLEGGLQDKYRALVEWSKETKRLTPSKLIKNNEWWAHLGTITSVMGEFFNESIYNKINRMKEQNLRGEYAQKEKLNDIANSIDGITNGYEEITQLIFMGSGTRVLTADEQGLTLSVKAGRRKFTTDELMRVYALSKNPIQRAKLERQGFTDEVMADIEEFLDSRLTEFVDKTVEYLSNEYYEGINDVYVKVNDVNLGYMENYFPTRTQFQGDLATQSRDQLLSSTYSGPNSQMADALKERVDTGSDVLMNEGLGFHGELGNHINTMERFKAYSVGVQEINAILSDSFTVSLSELLGMGKVLNDGVSAAVMPDVFKSDLDFKTIDKWQSRFVMSALAFKPMQVVKQMTSAIAGVKEYQYGKEKNLPVDILMFSMDFVRLLPKLILEGVSLGKYKGPVSTMIEDSATLRRRIEDNFGGDLYGLTSGVSGRTRRVTARDYTLASKALKGLARAGGTATSAGDVAGVMGYLPAYMRDIQNGMSKEEAIEKFNQYNKTQQSRREAERAPIQTKQDGVRRLLTAFTSSQLLYLNEIVTTANNMNQSVRRGERIKASDSRGFALALVGYSVMFMLATNMWKLMFGDDEEKERAWKRVLISPISIFYVIPLIGPRINQMANWFTGDNYPVSAIKDPYERVTREVVKSVKDEDYLNGVMKATEFRLGTNLDMFRGMMDIANGQPMDESFYDVMGVPPSQRPED